MNNRRYIFAAIFLVILILLLAAGDFYARLQLDREKHYYQQQVTYVRQLVPLQKMWNNPKMLRRVQRKLRIFSNVEVRREGKALHISSERLTPILLERIFRLICNEPVTIKKCSVMRLNPGTVTLRMVLE